MPSPDVTFVNADGVELAGRLDLPEGTPTSYALFAHCFTCSKRTIATARTCRALTEHGVAVLRFDFTGLGDSGGDFAESTFSGSVDDLVAAADWLRRTHEAPQLLIGHSLGGAAVLAAAARIPEARAVATINAPADTSHAAALLSHAEAEIRDAGVAEVEIAGRRFRIGQGLLDDLRSQPQGRRIAALGRPLLVMHSPADEVVPVDNARVIFETAAHPKSFVALDGASHLLDDSRDARYVAALIAVWSSRHVAMSQAADVQLLQQ